MGIPRPGALGGDSPSAGSGFQVSSQVTVEPELPAVAVGGVEVVCGLPAIGGVSARESLHGGRGGMGTSVNGRDELPCSTEQRLFLPSSSLCLIMCHCHRVRLQGCLQLTQLPGDP